MKMRPNSCFFLAVTCLFGAILTGCGSDSAQTASTQNDDRSKPPAQQQIVTTTAIVKDLIANVAGDRAEVSGLMGEGIDPHLYKPSRDDLVRLQNADVVFYTGLGLEGRMLDVLEKLSAAGKPVFGVAELLPQQQLGDYAGHGHHHDHNQNHTCNHGVDPHVWMNVALWSQTADIAAKELAEIDSQNAEQYVAQAQVYREKLEALDQYAKRVLSSIPVERRYLITAHNAFGHFGRAYDTEVVSIQGMSTESEAGVQDINKLVDLIVEKQVPAIFVEASVSDENVVAILEGAQSRGWNVKIGGTLFSESMGEPGTYEGTYIGMIDHNVTTIARALGGNVPAQGHSGHLAGGG